METCRFICISERGGKRFYAPGNALEPAKRVRLYYIGSAEGHEYPDLLVGDEVNPRTLFVLT